VGLSAVTVLGPDRPGLIADVAGSLAECGLSVRDSTMTLLGGYVAMLLLVSGDLPATELDGLLSAPGALVTAAAVEAGPAPGPRHSGLGYLLTVHGSDSLGILAAVSAVLAAVGGHVTAMSTRLSGRLFVLIAEVELPADVDVADLMRRLAEVGAGFGAEITFRPCEPDLL